MVYTISDLSLSTLNPIFDKAIARCCHLATNIIQSWKDGILLRCGHVQCLILKKDREKSIKISKQNVTLHLLAKCCKIDDEEEVCREGLWNVVLDLSLCIEAILHTSKLIVKVIMISLCIYFLIKIVQCYARRLETSLLY